MRSARFADGHTASAVAAKRRGELPEVAALVAAAQDHHDRAVSNASRLRRAASTFVAFESL